MDVIEYQKQGLASLNKVFGAIAKGKFAPVANEAQILEIALRRGLHGLVLLDALRKYFLETTGETSPFVKQIDRLMPRDPTG